MGGSAGQRIVLVDGSTIHQSPRARSPPWWPMVSRRSLHAVAPTVSPLRCHLSPPMNDCRSWISRSGSGRSRCAPSAFPEGRRGADG